jgi:hypothetical protein
MTPEQTEKLESSVCKYLDVSTGNLPQKEFDALGWHEKVIMVEHPYGCWVLVPPDDDGDSTHTVLDDLPTLATLFDAARELSCRWINFDADAPLLEGFQTFDW